MMSGGSAAARRAAGLLTTPQAGFTQRVNGTPSIDEKTGR